MSSALRLRSTRVAALLALACISAIPAVARESAKRPDRAREVQTVEPAAPEPARTEPAGAWTAGTAPPADCTRARRKLWQPEQGWIVKSVTTCH